MPKTKAPASSSSELIWEWMDDKGTYRPFSHADASMVEAEWQKGLVSFSTVNLSISKGTYQYLFNFVAMFQQNVDTGLTRAIKRTGPASSTAKMPKIAIEWWIANNSGGWSPFNSADAELLEKKWKTKGSKDAFELTGFTFENPAYKYEISFKNMTQTNPHRKKTRAILRGDGSGKPPGGKPAMTKVWQVWGDEKKWMTYSAEHTKQLETAYSHDAKIFVTEHAEWRSGKKTPYIFDFTTMSQINTESGKSRKMRRGDAAAAPEEGHETDPYEPIDIFSPLKKPLKTKGLKKTAPLPEFVMPESALAAQRKSGAQSLRPRKAEKDFKPDYGPVVKSSAHAIACFDEMLQNEKHLCGKYAVFYHSYSHAALLYEVQAAIAAVLFRFNSEFGALPRLLWEPFKHIPNAQRMLEEFAHWSDKDENPAFRRVGLCAVESLLAHDSEAPPTSQFMKGYSIWSSVSHQLPVLLKSCGVPSSKVDDLAKEIVAMANAAGLDTNGYPGGKSCASGHAGHYLQIFVRRDLVDRYVYPSFAYGVPDGARFSEKDKGAKTPFSAHLGGDKPMKGQVRLTVNPEAFLWAEAVRIFTFSADKTFASKRKGFQSQLTKALGSILNTEALRTATASQIFCGTPPAWWTAESQLPKSHEMTLDRYKKEDMAYSHGHGHKKAHGHKAKKMKASSFEPFYF